MDSSENPYGWHKLVFFSCFFSVLCYNILHKHDFVMHERRRYLMKKTHVIQLRVDEDLYSKIVENADSMGLTVSSYVRFALLKFLKVFR